MYLWAKLKILQRGVVLDFYIKKHSTMKLRKVETR